VGPATLKPHILYLERQMKFREFKKLVNKVDDKFLDAIVWVDTEAAEYSLHMVDPTSVYSHEAEEMGVPFVSISLDHSVKKHWSAQARIDFAEKLKKELTKNLRRKKNEVPKV